MGLACWVFIFIGVFALTTLKNIVYGSSHNPGIITIKLICDGLEISLYDFFDTDSFKRAEMEDIG